MSFIEDFMKQFGGETASELASNLGIKKSAASQMIPQIAPLILGGLKRQKDTHGGAERVDHILNKYGSADVLDHIHDMMAEKAHDQNPDPRLGGLLGDSGVQAAQMIGQKFKLDAGAAAKLIPMISPLILGALSQKRDKDGAGSSGIAALIDQDGDGSILDDVGGFLMKGLLGGGGRGSGNVLGSLLGGLFGGKRR